MSKIDRPTRSASDAIAHARNASRRRAAVRRFNRVSARALIVVIAIAGGCIGLASWAQPHAERLLAASALTGVAE